MVAHSSGNHGFAVAYAARLLGVSAAIVVPENAPAVKTDAIESTGAELIRVEPTLAARIAATDEIARVRGYHPVAPFDDRDVIAGQGTIGLEIAEDFVTGPQQGREPPAAVLVPISGGGLISGIAVAVKALLPGTRVIGVEPELAADARDSLRAGTRVAWTAAQTARTSADALRVEAGRRADLPAHPGLRRRHRHGHRGRDQGRHPPARQGVPADRRAGRRDGRRRRA